MLIDTKAIRLKYRRTKIVATLGPASSDPDTLEKLLTAGVNVVRLNMSHGDHDSHRTTYERVRSIAAKLDLPIAVLADLCGPKIRVGELRDGSIPLEVGSTVTVTTREVLGEPGLIPSQYAALANDVRPGNRILLADGDMELEVREVEGTEVECVVVRGGLLKNHKGVNLPGVNVSEPALTDKDREDARFALGLGVDCLALSFVRSGDDIRQLKELIAEEGGDALIIAKIERPQALDNYEQILDEADAIMVARGDLGVELPAEEVPVAQQLLVDRARARNRPVIVATQMLESMIEHGRPTRAEVTDVSYAVSNGADAVMLSAETAAGKYPVQAVTMMDRIARQTEGYLWSHGYFGTIKKRVEHDEEALPIGDAIARSTAQLSRDLLVRAIVVASESGHSTTVVSSARPAAPVLGVATSEHTCRRVNLAWGVVPVPIQAEDLADVTQLARRLSREIGLAEPGQNILLVRGFKADPIRTTPSVTVLCVPHDS